MNLAAKTDAGARVVFDKDLGSAEPIPEDGIEDAVALMRDGRLFRYGEHRGALPAAALLEEEFAAFMGRSYCIGVNSGGCALFLALKASGVEAGDKVLVNAFTLAPVPGAIAHLGAEAVLVDISERYVIDIDDLDRKARDSGARFLLLSYMRGHIPDMDAVMQICDRHGLHVIEDCAHTMGAAWDSRLTGAFGSVGCFSSQTFKNVNSGEGGLIVTDNEDIAARAVLLSGSYMLYAQHRARPPLDVFERHKYEMPNCSMRMSNLIAAILRPQLRLLDERGRRWREIYDRLAAGLQDIPHIRLPQRPAKEAFVPTSLQFSIDDLEPSQIAAFLADAARHGVVIKWFGAADPAGFTSRHDHWRYLDHARGLPAADRILERLCDLRLPLSLTDDDCATVATVVRQSMAEIADG